MRKMEMPFYKVIPFILSKCSISDTALFSCLRETKRCFPRKECWGPNWKSFKSGATVSSVEMSLSSMTVVKTLMTLKYQILEDRKLSSKSLKALFTYTVWALSIGTWRPKILLTNSGVVKIADFDRKSQVVFPSPKTKEQWPSGPRRFSTMNILIDALHKTTHLQFELKCISVSEILTTTLFAGSIVSSFESRWIIPICAVGQGL